MHLFWLIVSLWLSVVAAEIYPEENFVPYFGSDQAYGEQPYPYDVQPTAQPSPHKTSTVTVTIIVTQTRSSSESTSLSTSGSSISTSTVLISTSSTGSSSSSASPSATNLIQDPGFEDGDLNDNYDSNFVVNNTFSTTFVGLTQPGDNSPNAARLYVSTTGGRTTPAGISQLVVVTPGATYAFSYDLAISIAQPADDSECDLTVAVDQLVVQTIPLLAVQDYVRYSTSFVAVNSTPYLYLTLTCTGGTGEVEIDNLFLIAT